MARCRRNVDNFLEACRRIGVEEGHMCRREDIVRDGDVDHDALDDGNEVEGYDVGGLPALAKTVSRLLRVVEDPPPESTLLSTCLCIILFFVSMVILYLLPSSD